MQHTYRLNEVFKVEHTIKADSLADAMEKLISMRDDTIEMKFESVELVSIDGKPTWLRWYDKPENITVEDLSADR